MVLCSQEDDIRGFVRQEMSQHCGEWVSCGVSCPHPILGHLDRAGKFPELTEGHMLTGLP